MKTTSICPKCGARRIIRVPDHPCRHASGNNIYTTSLTLLGKVPVIRYVCRDCGYTENWVETEAERAKLAEAFGEMSL